MDTLEKIEMIQPTAGIEAETGAETSCNQELSRLCQERAHLHLFVGHD